MRWTPLLLVLAVVAPLACAQAPLFRVLDDPLPPDAFGDAIADLDGDGDVDLLNKLGIYVNDGHARFTGPVPCLLSFPRKRTVLADLNGDGLADCVSIDGFNNLRIDFNSGGLAFTGPTFGPAIPSPWLPSSLSSADVDLDGDVDLLIGLQQNPPSGTVGTPVLWLNGGLGTFTQAPPIQFPALQHQAVLTRDLDGNGYPDALLTSSTTSPNLIVGFNTGGVFTASATAQWSLPGLFPGGSVVASDFNGDGLVDLAAGAYVVNWGVSVNFNSPAGFTGFPAATGGQVNAMQALDVNGDGVDELVVSNYDPSYFTNLSLHAVLPTGTLGPALQPLPAMSFGSFWGSVPVGPDAVKDLDGDGDRDLIVVSARTPMLLTNAGNGSLVPLGGHAPGILTGLPLVGEVDGDGAPDILGFRYPQSSTSSWFVTGLNAGDGFFHLGSTTSLSLPYTYPSMYSLYAFDRDGDGDTDVFAAGNYLTASTAPPASDRIFDNVGGSFVPSLTVPSTGSVVALQAFDFDSDGDQDILMARRNYVGTNGITGPMRYIQNNGLAGMAASVAVGGNHSSYDLDLGDFDGNGTMDAFQTNKEYSGAADPCVVYLNPGNAAFVPVAQGFSGWFAAAGELNGDNMTDLVVDGTVYFATGGGAFAPGPALPAALVAKSVLADVDLDGDLDLVETPATVMLNQGGANFAPPVSFLPLVAYVPWSWEVPASTVVDVDRDGDPDIIAPGPVVVSNVMRQLAHGSWARLGRPASIDLSGTAGGPWYLFASAATALIPAPPFGYALIDPASAVLFANGAFDAGGAASLGANVPNVPGIVGWTSYWQAVDAATLKATNRIAITVLSY